MICFQYKKLPLHAQIVEFKSSIRESQSSRQKEVQKAKHEARAAIEAKEEHAAEKLRREQVEKSAVFAQVRRKGKRISNQVRN